MASSNNLTIVRSIPMLSKMVGTTASLVEHKTTVRNDMKRRLQPAERRAYRGITHTGEPWLMFEQLYNIDTTEDIIKAEEIGVYHSPIDEPGKYYLFACGFGLVAAVHSRRAAQLVALSEHEPGCQKSLQQLHNEYRDTSQEPKDWEGVFNEVAEDHVKWACQIK